MLDLTLRRFRQVKQAIDFRRALTSDRELDRIEWQTRALMGQMVGMAQSKEGAKAMSDQAEKLAIRPPRAKVLDKDLPEGLDFDPEAEPDYSTMKIRPTREAGMLGRLERPRG